MILLPLSVALTLLRASVVTQLTEITTELDLITYRNEIFGKSGALTEILK